MKDFIASKMRDGDWRDILRENLPEESEEVIERNSNKEVYKCSYAVIRKLTERRRVVYWSDMRQILTGVNKNIICSFEKKFQIQMEGK